MSLCVCVSILVTCGSGVHCHIFSHTHTHTYTYIHYITLHYITLHYIALHYITLHYITVYITYICICTYICMYVYIYIHIFEMCAFLDHWILLVCCLVQAIVQPCMGHKRRFSHLALCQLHTGSLIRTNELGQSEISTWKKTLDRIHSNDHPSSQKT